MKATLVWERCGIQCQCFCRKLVVLRAEGDATPQVKEVCGREALTIYFNEAVARAATGYVHSWKDCSFFYRFDWLLTDEQRAAAKASLDRYQEKLAAAGFGDIQTTVVDAPMFYFAEDHHQQYLHRNPMGYCNHGFCQVVYD